MPALAPDEPGQAELIASDRPMRGMLDRTSASIPRAVRRASIWSSASTTASKVRRIEAWRAL